MALSALVSACDTTEKNPLLGEFNTPHQTPPFADIKVEHFLPAFEEGIRQSREEIDAIVNNPEAPTFENTIEALERQGALLTRTSEVFFPLTSSLTSPELQETANKVMPMLTELGNDISLNEKLFARVKAVYDYYAQTKWETHPLDLEQQMLLEDTYKGFARSGAALSEQDKETYRKITAELSTLSLDFDKNILDVMNSYSLNIPLEDSAKVAYMPDFVKAGMAEDAKTRGQEGWTVTLHAPSITPFMVYSKERDLKETLWRATNTRCYNGEHANNDIVKRLVELRLQLANLLGYDTYADFVLEERMAESTETVNNFLNELLDPTKKWADAEYKEIVEFAKQFPDAPKEIMPWDFAYYKELFQTHTYDLNDEMVKPYFQLDKVEEASFMLANKLYGITFKPNDKIELYHPDAKAFEVYDNDGSFLAVLYVDYFPRESKRGGAWMTNFREMYTTADGVEVRPVVSLNYNFTKPTEDSPSLLTFTEVTTVLHEFGHGLHGMLARGRYHSMTGTNVYRDFVELPSQLMENWAYEKEFLDLFATHYKTGEKMPEELIRKIVDSKNFMSAYGNVRQLSFGFNDMAWHTITAPVDMDVAKFETLATGKAQIGPKVDGTCMSTAFGHIFSGGYSAGYYSYKWAEVLEADAFSLFQEKGIFNREVAESFRKNILEKGGSEHPMTLYVNFRGHKPEPAALVEKVLHGRE